MQTPKKEVHFFFFLVCCIVFNCSWQLVMFVEKQNSCVNRIHLVTVDGLYSRQAFHKNCFYSSSMFLFIRTDQLLCVSKRSGILSNIRNQRVAGKSARTIVSEFCQFSHLPIFLSGCEQLHWKYRRDFSDFVHVARIFFNPSDCRIFRTKLLT